MASSNAESGKQIHNKLWLWHDLKVFLRLGHVTWPRSVTWPLIKLKFLHNMSNWSRNSYWKFGGAARRRFPAIAEKPPGGRLNAPPPGRARVKAYFCFLAFGSMLKNSIFVNSKFRKNIFGNIFEFVKKKKLKKKLLHFSIGAVYTSLKLWGTVFRSKIG